MQAVTNLALRPVAAVGGLRSGPDHRQVQCKPHTHLANFARTSNPGASLRRLTRSVPSASSPDGALEPLPEPDNCRGAIALGLRVFEEGDYEGALQLFNKALDLPGTGTKRFRDKPPGISEGERQAVYYNLACCYGKLGNNREGLIAVAGLLEAGYIDFAQLRTDPDLEELRQEPKFEGLLARFDRKPAGGPLGKLFEGFL